MLFDVFSRTDDAKKRPQESSYEYLNRSSRVHVMEARNRLDHWYNNYPRDHRANLASKFKGKNEEQHLSAFWELLLHHWMHQQEFNPEVSAATPDFWANFVGVRVAIEAATLRNRTEVSFSELESLTKEGARECSLYEHVREALRKKAKQTGKQKCPLMIAVNVCDDLLDEIDVEDALFGHEKLSIRQPHVNKRTVYVESQSRKGDGAFGTFSNPKYTRVSACLVARSVSPFSPLPIECHVYENPYAEREIPELPGQIRQKRTAWGDFEYYRRTFELQ